MKIKKITTHLLLTLFGTALFAAVLSLFQINLLEWPALFIIPGLGFIAGVAE